MVNTEKIPVGQISSLHISKQIAVEGIIDKIWPVKAKLIKGAFKCQRCDHITFFGQPLTDELIEPFECENDVCGRKGPFILVHEESAWIDEQRIKLQDFYDSLKPGQQLKDIIVLVRGQELIDTIPTEGAHINITGIIRVMEKRGKSLFDKVLEANHIETIEAKKDFDSLDLGMDKTMRERTKVLREIIREVQDAHKSAAPLEDIIIKAEESGIKKDLIEHMIQKLKSAGEVIEASNNRFRVV